MRSELHVQIKIAAFATSNAFAALPRETDFLPRADVLWHGHGDRLHAPATVYAERFLPAVQRFLDGDGQIKLRILPTPRSIAALLSAPAKKHLEKIAGSFAAAEIKTTALPRRLLPAGLIPIRAEFVVAFAFFNIAEHLVGLVDFLEFRLRRFLVLRHIGMMLPREFAEGFADVVLRRRLRDAESCVVVLELHRAVESECAARINTTNTISPHECHLPARPVPAYFRSTMCGIVGYIGKHDAVPVLLDGLRRLEYRGYDSAGIATLADGKISVRKKVGRIANLAELIAHSPVTGHVGIAHTRWATHGGVTDENAHPHSDQSGRLFLCHNGVIENYTTIKEQLIGEGHTFKSQTDTEVLAHLIGKEYDALASSSSSGTGVPPVGVGQASPPVQSTARLVEALRSALSQVVGTYGIILMHADAPGVIIGARRGSPLVLGIGSGENFFASDVSAIVAHTREAVYLKDFDIAVLGADDFEITSLLGGASGYEVSKVEFSAEDVSKGSYAHYMLKEIHEQPDTIRDAMRGRLVREEATAKLSGLGMTPQQFREVDRIILTGCGTASHAAMCGEYIIEALAHVPVEVEFASEFRYRNLPLPKDTLVFCISQSGETADTLAALREGKRKGLRVLGICNNVASTIARESDGGVYMHAGPEIGVAATKSFTSQVTIMALLGLMLGRIRHLSTTEGLRILDELEALPGKVARILEQSAHIQAVAEKYAHAKAMMFLGRQFNYPAALEGALKMKEISYIHASGYPSAELKHGVIALITPEVPSVFIAPKDSVFEKNVSNIEEVKARSGPIIAVGTEGCDRIAKVADDVLWIPECPDYLSPILASIPLQLLAYYTAVHLGCDVDKPRNLAKSVTVE